MPTDLRLVLAFFVFVVSGLTKSVSATIGTAEGATRLADDEYHSPNTTSANTATNKMMALRSDDPI
ncbi:MAG: hypothetical protein NC111_00020 [Bacteroides sp.]|nr:hypothetical protein [Bacteroides sp.]MCM1412804.1 hypothetical protein [Bacteroides sp.]MCM1470902.1 hypothetical protein [Bacteroides sp.]